MSQYEIYALNIQISIRTPDKRTIFSKVFWVLADKPVRQDRIWAS